MFGQSLRLVPCAFLVATVAWIAPVWPCSVFTGHDATTVLAGNNEDSGTEYIYVVWFVPASAGKYGYVAYGRSTLAQPEMMGGMNDQGVFWDGLSTPVHPVTTVGPNPVPSTFREEVMQASATVDEAIANLKQYDLTNSEFTTAQVLLVDKNGDSAIFDGTTVTKPTDNYLIGTNFLTADPTLGGWPCARYTTIENMMKQGLQLTVDYFRDIAKAAQQGTAVGATVFTRYTTIADLKAGKLYLYYERDFDNPIEFDLATELAKGDNTYKMADLFKQEPDAGVDAAVDAGVDAAVSGDSGAPADTSDEGCSCATGRGRPRSGSHSALPWLALLLAVVIRLRPRRR
jgi:MYXO-CTERM domain-containing protein